MKLIVIFRSGSKFSAGEIQQGQFIVVESLVALITGNERSEVEKEVLRKFPEYSRNNNLSSTDPRIVAVWSKNL